jgi:hypothetical protein
MERPMRCHTSARGAALVDVVFTCGLIATLAAVAIPTLHAARERDAALLAARHLASRLHSLRIEALRRNRAVALRFDSADPGRLAAFVDGDGDGVRQTDVDAGLDSPLGVEMHVRDLFDAASVAVPTTVPAPDGVGSIAAGSDPIRIGSSDFVSFSAAGSATSGTIYLTSGGTQVCVRVFGATGRIRVLRFDRGTLSWRYD